MKPHYYLFLIMTFISILTAGCTPGNGRISQPTETPVIKLMPTLMSTDTPTPTLIPTSTATPTITPTPKPLSWRISPPTNYRYESMDQTVDGNYIVIATRFYFTTSNGEERRMHDGDYLFLLDHNGNILWEKDIPNEEYCVFKQILQTRDKGFILAGDIPFSENDHICLVKTDMEGNLIWNIHLGVTSSTSRIVTGQPDLSVEQTQEGGYIVLGETYPPNSGTPDLLLVKTDPEGNVEWEQTFGGNQIDQASSVQQTTDGGYIIAARTWSFGSGESDAWVIKTDSTGNLIWEQTFGDTNLDNAYSIQQTEDGGFIFTGTTYPVNSYNGNAWLVKLDQDGNLVWEQTYGGEDAPDTGNKVQGTSDGGYIIFGETDTFGAGSFDLWLIKTDKDGNLVWDKTFGDENQDIFLAGQQTSDSGYILLGYNSIESSSDLIKTDSDGNVENGDG
ncbi:MAG: hypothetical protein H0S79_03900 [Anaerolineaceae bacterium]|nr:hypothetical protein [Anaerolineaceae bacterium]